ncbi:MAG: sporulation protein YqfD [Defluviitaleaceae bacterium]|nr:sporulation protein YqfD [Defluviitaleaceae bacterium]
MLMRLWLWLRGYVRVSITGFTLERFLNMAAFHRIYLWDVIRTDEGVEAFVSIKGFKQLRPGIRKTKTRVRILRRYGFPFLVHRYRKRKLLVGGVLFFALAIYALSLFVWRVDIVGTETLSHDEIHEFLADHGLHVGRFKFTINHDELTRALLAAHEQIGFAYIRTRGTRTTVLLAEAVPAISIIDRDTPTHVIADREGLITNITAGAGAPLAGAGDVVRPGEILVSGMLQISPDDPGTEIVFVHAYAEVWARRYYPIEFSVPLNYAQRVYTGRTANRHSVQLLFAGGRTLRFPSSGIPFAEYDRMTASNQLGASGDYPLPFVWMTTRYAEFYLQPRTRTMEQAHELAYLQLNARVLREFDLGLDIIEKRLEFEEAEDALHVQALVITNERIDRQIPIIQ